MLRALVRRLGTLLMPGLLIGAVLSVAGYGSPVMSHVSESSASLPALQVTGLAENLLTIDPSQTDPSQRVEHPDRDALQLHAEQQITFEHISSAEGLAGSVYWISQDHLGFLWLGTSDGLKRYDGRNFQTYRHDPDDPRSLSEDHVFNVLEDHRGNLWVATYGGGLDRLDRDRKQFTHYQFDPDDPHSLSHNKVFALFVDRAGVLWVGTSGGGLNRYDPTIDGFVHYRHDPDDPTSLVGDYVNIIYEDRSGVLWIGTTDGLDRFDREMDSALSEGVFTHYQHDPQDPYSLSNNQVFAIVEDTLGTLWVGTSGGGLNRLDRETGDGSVARFTHFRHDPDDPTSLSDDVVFVLLEDSAGTLWVASLGGGLHQFDRENEQFIRYQSDPVDPGSLSSNSVNAMFEDREGTLWIGTTAALDKYARHKETFHRFLDYPFTHSIFEDRQGSVWIGTSDALYQLDSNLEQVAVYRHDPNEPASLSKGWVLSIYEDRSGELWIGISGSGLDRLDRETGRFDHYRHDPGDRQSLSNDVVNVVYQDREGVLWVGTDGGLNLFDPQSGTFQVWPTDPAAPEAARVESIGVLVEDARGNLWVSSWGDGLMQRDRERSQVVPYRHAADDSHSLRTNFVTAIYEDSVGRLWVGTDGGLHLFQAVENNFRHYGDGPGSTTTWVGPMVEAEDGALWLATSGGLSEFDPDAGLFAGYDIEHGLHGGSFVAAAWKRSNGEMLFGGADGVVVFRPEEIQANPFPPPVRLVSLRQDGAEAELDQALEQAASVTFSWPQRDFEFEFVALSYVQPERNQHAYKLEGYDQDWNYIGTNRTGRYTNLPGGTYTLWLKGSNNNGVWNEEGFPLRVKVVPPLWSTWWFRVLAVLALGLVLVAGYRLRVRSVETRSRELERQVANRTKELSALNTIASVVSGSLDLGQILNNALDRTLEVTGLEAGGIYLLQGDAPPDAEGTLRIAAHRGLAPQLVEAIDNLAVGEGFSGRVVQTGEPLVVHDLSSDPRLTRTVVKEKGYHTLAVVPLVSRGTVLGSLFVMTRSEAEFSQRDVELLTSIGGQIGVAIENARLFKAEQRRAEQFRVITEVGHQIASILNIDEVLVQFVRLIQRSLDYDHAGIALIEDDEVVYKVGAGVLWDDPGFDFKPKRLRLGQESITGWVAVTGEPLLVPDVSQEPRYVWMRGSQTRSELTVPIKVKGEVIGVLDVQSNRLNAFDQSDLALLQSLANQAAVAIKNAQLFEGEQRRAEQFRVISEVGSRITSILAVDELLDQMVRLIKEAFGYYGVGIGLADGDDIVFKAGAGAFRDVIEVHGALRLKVGKEGLTGWVAATGEPLVVPDVSQDARYYYVPEVGETRSEICLPLKAKGVIIGVLIAQSDRLNAFDEGDVVILQSLVSQVAVAIENARLFDAEQRRAEQFRVISEVGSRITSILTVEELLDQMARLIQKAFDYYLVEIGLVEEPDLIFRTRASRYGDPQFQTFRLPVGKQSVTGWVAATGEPLLVSDVRQEPRYVRVTSTETQSELAVPMKVKEKIIGVINVESDRLDAFDQSDLGVLQSLAHQAAIAIENARLYEQAQRLAVMEERQRLARELHDAVTQTLFSASLIAEALPNLWESDPEEGRELLAELRQLSRGALAEMRTLLLELRPATLIEANLADLLHQLGEAVTGRTGIPVSVSIETECAFSPDVHVAFYRIVQEALNNVVKHSRASHVAIRLRCATPAGVDGQQRDRIELQVSDNGCGFDLEHVPSDRLGLGIIRERAQDIGAALEIQSRPGQGTRVTVVW